MIDNSSIIEKAIEEIESKSFGFTEQFLGVHQVIYINNKPKIARVDTEDEDGTAIVYFPIKDQRFYLAIYLKTEPEVSVTGIVIESDIVIGFIAISEALNFNELSELTILKSTNGWNKGDIRFKASNIFHKNSKIGFYPNREPDAFDDKLRKLLDFLEQDKAGVKNLIDKAEGYIQVAIEFYTGNTMLGGPHINKDIIKRLSDLNLEIDFDLYISGIPFK